MAVKYVALIRCKDCGKSYYDCRKNLWCDEWGFSGNGRIVNDDEFCSRGRYRLDDTTNKTIQTINERISKK